MALPPLGNLAELDRRCLKHLQELGLHFDHFFDVGASNGAWTRNTSADFPDAMFDLFEPLLEIAPGFKDRIEVALEGRRIRVHNFALGSESKRARMYAYGKLWGSTALELDHVPAHAQCVEVEMRTIDQVVQELGTGIPQVIKIDTQGCELSILQGARNTLPQVHVLFLECWLVRGYGQNTPLFLEIANWLRELDFHLFDFGDQWRDAQNNLGTQDCVFLNARCEISPLRNKPPLNEGQSTCGPDNESWRKKPGWLRRLLLRSD